MLAGSFKTSQWDADEGELKNQKKGKKENGESRPVFPTGR